MDMKSKVPMTGVLRPDVELIRGETMLLFDRQRDAYFKVDEQALKIISFLSESMPADLFLQHLARNGVVVAPEELAEILTFLRQNDLLLPAPGDVVRKKDAQEEYLDRNRLLRLASSYLFFRLPPWRPERFLEKASPFIGQLASRKMVILYTAVALIGYLLLLRDLGSAVTEFRNSLSWTGLVKYFFAIAAVKCVHETAHALAAVHFHCRVRGIGIGWMVFCPRLFTDTTDSWRLPRKQRLLIDSAGIVAELFIGGLAALLWSFLPPGALRSTMFYILTVSTLSTFIINGNPFIKYDGYYIFCDLIGADNLMGRAADTVRQYWRWYCFRIGKAPDLSAGWKLAVFGVCSFLYRIFLYTSIILVIYHRFNRVLALLMIVLELYAVLLFPLWREVRMLSMLSRRGSRKNLLLPGTVLLLLLLLLLLPLGWTEELPGEVCAKRRALVAVPEAGFLTEDLRLREVEGEEVLCSLHSPQLRFAEERMGKKYREETLLLKLQKQDEKLFAQSELTSAKLKSADEGLREISRKLRQLTVRSPLTGTFVPASRDMRAGKFLPKNTILGHVFSPDRIVVAYADDQQLGRLSVGQEAEVYFRGDLRSRHGVIHAVSIVPVALEASALLVPFGGVIPILERQSDPLQLQPVQPLYRVEIKLTGRAADLCLGQVAKVSVKKDERLGAMIWRSIVSIWRKELSL